MIDAISKFISKLKLDTWGGISLMLVLLIAVLFGINVVSKPVRNKRAYRETSSMLQSSSSRRSVFNVNKESVSVLKPSSSAPKSSGSWFSSPKSPEQIVDEELKVAMDTFERREKEYNLPIEASEDVKSMFYADNNRNLCYGRAAMERGDFKAAERYFKQAIDEGANNPFLIAYAYGELCRLYELTQSQQEYDNAFKLFAEAVSKLPIEFGGGGVFIESVRNVNDSLSKIRETVKTSAGMELFSKTEPVKTNKVSLSSFVSDSGFILNSCKFKVE